MIVHAAMNRFAGFLRQTAAAAEFLSVDPALHALGPREWQPSPYTWPRRFYRPRLGGSFRALIFAQVLAASIGCDDGEHNSAASVVTARPSPSATATIRPEVKVTPSPTAKQRPFSPTATASLSPTGAKTATASPSPTEVPACSAIEFEVQDPPEGANPDFRLLRVRTLPAEWHFELVFYPGRADLGTLDFIQLQSFTGWSETTREAIVVRDGGTFQLRRDGDRDFRYEELRYEGVVEWLSEVEARIRVPSSLFGPPSGYRLAAYAQGSGDQIPNAGVFRFACPETASPTPLPSSTPTPRPVDAWSKALAAARQKWREANLHSYRFRCQFFGCFFCSPLEGLVTVIRGERAAVQHPDTGEPISPRVRFDLEFPTIEKVFDWIESAIARPADRLLAEYDPNLGYPTTFYLDYDVHLFDEEFGLRILDVEEVVPPTLTPTPLVSLTPTATRTGTPTPTATPPPFVDNHDGTILDRRTGLLWEKKASLDGVPNPFDLHDADNTYSWAGLCADLGACQPEGTAQCPVAGLCAPCPQEAGPCSISESVFTWLAELNQSRFAGYSDWRLPTAHELGSLFDTGGVLFSEFHHPRYRGNCQDLTDPECSATSAVPYWSNSVRSEPVYPGPAWQAWAVAFFGTGRGVTMQPLTRPLAVRAVRTHLDDPEQPRLGGSDVLSR